VHKHSQRNSKTVRGCHGQRSVLWTKERGVRAGGVTSLGGMEWMEKVVLGNRRGRVEHSWLGPWTKSIGRSWRQWEDSPTTDTSLDKRKMGNKRIHNLE